MVACSCHPGSRQIKIPNVHKKQALLNHGTGQALPYEEALKSAMKYCVTCTCYRAGYKPEWVRYSAFTKAKSELPDGIVSASCNPRENGFSEINASNFKPIIHPG